MNVQEELSNLFMEATGDGDNESYSSYSSFMEDCLLFEVNPRKGSLVLDNEEELETNTAFENKAKIMKENFIKAQFEK